jgi:hypothetical protein
MVDPKDALCSQSNAVDSEHVSLAEACERYETLIEENVGPQAAIDSYGVPVLRRSNGEDHRSALKPDWPPSDRSAGSQELPENAPTHTMQNDWLEQPGDRLSRVADPTVTS